MDEHVSGAHLVLAKRADLTIGMTTIRPSLRQIEGPTGAADVAPRVMQVLLALHDARGGVLSRDDLLAQCWAGMLVGDDAINRTIGEIRRVIRATGADLSIETIPRVGYRLDSTDFSEAHDDRKPFSVDRRKLMIGGAAALSLAGSAGAAILYSDRRTEIDVLIERGRVLQASGDPAQAKRAEGLFRSAVKRDPGRPDAWGWLARVLEDRSDAREAANRALALDPREVNARAVLIVQRRDIDEWVDWEDALLELLAEAPDNTLALEYLSMFYQACGRCKDNWDLGERLYLLEPLNPNNLHRRAFRHWIFGKFAQADKIADQSLLLWPRHPYVWNARLMIYAFTDRAPAALALLEDVPNRPPNLTQPSVESWRAALRAIDTRAPVDIASAVEKLSAVAVLAHGLAANAIMVFSYLGELDSAYRVADGLFEGRGSLVQQKRGEGIRDVYSGAAWGRTQFLFIPATVSFRADIRFQDMCERTGHVAYWRKRGIWPDPFVRGFLRVAG